MIARPSHRAPRVFSTLALAATAALLLSGCGPDASGPATSSPAPSASATPGVTDPQPSTDPNAPAPSPGSTPGASAKPDVIVSSPLSFGCADLVSAEAMMAFNPNFSLLPTAKPAAGTGAATIAGMTGLVCQWQNDTSGETIDIAVAKLAPGDIESLKTIAYTQSNIVPTYGAMSYGDGGADEGYFTPPADAEGQGEAQIFRGSYWMTMRSVAFIEPGDPLPLTDVALPLLAG